MPERPAPLRLVELVLDNLCDLPRGCRTCVFWELDANSGDRAIRAGMPSLEKEAWISATLMQWGTCGWVGYAGTEPAGYVLYAPPSRVPRSATFPTAPVSADAVLLAAALVLPRFTGHGLGRALVQAASRDLGGRGVQAVEAYGDTHARAGGCVVPSAFLEAVGFRTVRAHHRFPRLRMELVPFGRRRAHARRATGQGVASQRRGMPLRSGDGVLS